MQRRIVGVSLATLFVVATFALTARPADADAAFGGRIGGSIDPDGFVIGVHADIGPLAPNFYITPSVDFGFGDITTFTINGDAKYMFMAGQDTRPYIGAGLTYASYDVEGGSADEFGLTILGGVQFKDTSSKPLFLEGRLGLGDLPEFRILGGITFR
ncbi:MAG: outer membrane protein [Candidatus Eiseniibacteriota bacterium]